MNKTLTYFTKLRFLFLLLLLSIWGAGCSQNIPLSEINFIVASDMGRSGVSEQRNVAAQMAYFAEQKQIDFMAIAGDPIHDDGVKSVDDPLWNERIEDVYTYPSLHAFPWYVVSGNHEYNGSVQAILDYSTVSERWNAPARYYSFTKKPNGSNVNCLFVFIDTTPFIERYQNRTDAGEQDVAAQIAWIENTLSTSDAKWKFVVGHHPAYAKTNKSQSERINIQDRVAWLFEKYEIDFFISGHIHNFQHINREGSSVHYVVNSSASQSRPIHEPDKVEGTLFTNPDPGFSMFTVSEDNVRFLFVNHTGKIVYDQTIMK